MTRNASDRNPLVLNVPRDTSQIANFKNVFSIGLSENENINKYEKNSCKPAKRIRVNRITYGNATENLVERPAAEVEDGPAGGVERGAEHLVRLGDLVRVDVAAVELHHVDAPLGERLRVERECELRARIARAGGRADVRVYAQLEAAGV